MQTKRKKSIIVIIVILLIIMAPLAIIGSYLKFSGYKTKEPVEFVDDKNKPEKEEETEDPNYKDGILYFYNKNKELIGQYTCQKAPCRYAVSEIDDTAYAIDYLNAQEAAINVILNQYAFIEDDNKIILYDITKNEIVAHYEAVKNYHNNIPEDLMIVKNDEGKWGIIRLGETIQAISEFSYDFIGLINKIGENNLIDSSNFVVKTGNLWGIIDSEGDLISNYLASDISSYNELLISIKNNDTYYLYDYYGKRVINENGFNYVSFTDKYLNIVDKDNNLYVYDYGADKKLSSNMKLEGQDYKKAFTSSFDANTNTINVTIGDKDYNFSVS